MVEGCDVSATRLEAHCTSLLVGYTLGLNNYQQILHGDCTRTGQLKLCTNGFSDESELPKRVETTGNTRFPGTTNYFNIQNY